MAKNRRASSPALEKAQLRMQGAKSFNPTFDFGDGLTVAAYQALMDDVQMKLEAYLQIGALLDEKLNSLQEAEGNLNRFSVRMLSAVAAKYGTDSSEYEQIGARRVSERRRSSRKSNPPESSS